MQNQDDSCEKDSQDHWSKQQRCNVTSRVRFGGEQPNISVVLEFSSPRRPALSLMLSVVAKLHHRGVSPSCAC